MKAGPFRRGYLRGLTHDELMMALKMVQAKETGSRRVSHEEGEKQGSEGKGEELVQQEKRKEQPELKVVISNLKPFCFCFQYS